MDTFRTAVDIPTSENKISYHSHCFFIGSCFTESIGNYMKDLKFKTDINPFGIVYNPISIKNSIDFLLNGKIFTEKDLDFHNDIWFSFHHHSRFSDTDKKSCLEKINNALQFSTGFFKKSDFLFITLGTSFIYTHKEKNSVVSNCHKLPSEIYTKSLLRPEEFFSDFSNLIKRIITINPSLKIIFTVSPVRHMNNGFIENQRSKSILFVAIHSIMEKFENCSYFPAYEIMMDELRDYRFYANDMIHPGETAIDYIRQKFTETHIDKASQEIMAEIKKLVQAKSHKTFFPGTPANKKFLKKNMEKITEMKKKFSFLDLKEFEEYFQGPVE
jgi:hypothetical protein